MQCMQNASKPRASFAAGVFCVYKKKISIFVTRHLGKKRESLLLPKTKKERAFYAGYS